MVEATEKFLVDSNSFMTPFRFYYAFDLIPSYWKELSNPLISKYLVVLDMVKDEIDTGQDDLSRWLDGIENLQICPHVTPEIITKYKEVLHQDISQIHGLSLPLLFMDTPLLLRKSNLVALVKKHLIKMQKFRMSLPPLE